MTEQAPEPDERDLFRAGIAAKRAGNALSRALGARPDDQADEAATADERSDDDER